MSEWWQGYIVGALVASIGSLLYRVVVEALSNDSQPRSADNTDAKPSNYKDSQ